MTKRIAISVAVVVAVLSWAQTASAFTEFGNNCPATLAAAISNTTAFQFEEAPGNAIPLTAPSAGVVTRWRINTLIGGAGVPAKLKVLRGGPEAFQVVGESNEETLYGSQNVFETRIPVQAGDRLGIYAKSGFVACAGGASDKIGLYEGDVAVGSVHGAGSPVANAKLALSAFLEPDADHDGYGDETQDGCPTDASTHGPCPLPPAPAAALKLDAFPNVLKHSVLLLVSASADSSVTVSGLVSWKAPKHGARSSKTAHKPKVKGTVAKLSGGTQKVEAGSIARFNVRFPGSLKKELAQLPRGKSIEGTLTASAVDAAGKPVSRTVAIRLHGKKNTHKPRK